MCPPIYFYTQNTKIMKKKPSSLHTRENDLHAVKIRKKKSQKNI